MSKFHELTVASVTRETRDAVAVTFAVPDELADAYRYVQGQHLTLRTGIDGEDVRRSYSICSAVQDAQLRVAIKRVDGGLFSNWANEQLRPGMKLEVMPPSGHFHVPLSATHAKHYVAFAAGSGITPMLSIIKTTLQAEPESRFTLFYGNRASSSVLFKEELEDLKDTYLQRFNLVFVLSREQLDIDLFNGRIDGDKVNALLEHWVSPQDIDVAFICGPHSMMEEVSQALLDNGVDKARIKRELFATSIPSARPVAHAHKHVGQQQCEVTVIQDGRTRSFTLEKNKETVLDAALAQGIELPYSCKGGVCSTCRCKRIEGEVDMDVNFALEDYEVARGFILSCQSYAVSDKLVIDFDQET
ncbi:subunit of multicomponent oxygenase, phenylacetic acid degradation, putative 2Fe-2S ferredoxin-NADPH reductase; ring-hydroxylating complex protein 5 [Cupriavidus taiwanensis]|uniref:Subunit of multicomponent oxygenase, phenylacetic acid degradation, putative 2Fe-2S ferredoxin-NADPH reductase ring-hydroxylating complex protein 5 n=1 Tax=Cupriavidus taiwanensis TaxID=164546 RepID=A0A976B1I9_9BURK|nr:1,2-phenylacetyl-CoA epoxidase subunit PaaE [Cupriavidus taiwanensis]SOZ66119.1 subunit of multicomponent oxygenase, phenylacetic acid degradation, putative 2Fe-2S ferredoxin-NADPH reductase; ring-hydroxylating complex protein 5 [Cupriavidus taiwanensis]SOZ67065.1 subunit of multicomponent oxygenase, phenylacetic acid degradation, putative 2Fe-2S ferredoxin-NADPH reductase; ring-hydroxylating complex protein 5 [Cupriavidus taiwanensis]SOZ70595.1 subunit of multicomponent oxygenase, phenylacet